MRPVTPSLIVAALLSITACPVASQDHAAHMRNEAPVGANTPREGGQAAFAAIEEVIASLERDPATNWQTVNIDRLRQHLVDMDNVTIRARVTTVPIAGGARFDVSNDDEAVRASIQRMVAAHTAMAALPPGQKQSFVLTATGAALTVIGPDDASQTKIRALGFFGILALGVDHRMHHRMMATGEMAH
jgi:hypothetical protein